MRLVVSGYVGFGNAGDEASLAGLLQALRKVAGDLEATVVSGDPAQTAAAHGVRAIGRMAVPDIVRALRRSDGLVSGPGSLFQDRTSPRAVPYYDGVTRLARLARRPYVIYAQGLGPLKHWLARRIAASCLRGAAYVSLRDDESIALARSLGVNGSIDLVPDPALALSPPARPGPRRIVVAVRDWGPDPSHLRSMREALRVLAADHRVLAVPMQDDRDRRPSLEAIEGVPGAEVLASGASLDDQLGAIGSASLVIGMRLHALVLAAAAGVPAIAVSYDPKVDAFAARAGQAVVGHVDAPIAPSAIVEAARQALTTPLDPYLARIDAMRSDLGVAAAATVSVIERLGRGRGA